MTRVSFYPRSEWPNGVIELWLSDPNQRPAQPGWRGESAAGGERSAGVTGDD